MHAVATYILKDKNFSLAHFVFSFCLKVESQTLKQSDQFFLVGERGMATPVKTSWAAKAAAAASLPAPAAPKAAAPVKTAPPKPVSKASSNNATTTTTTTGTAKKTSKKGGGKKKKDLPYDRSTPNYRPELLNVVPTVNEVRERA
jgi:hypothetical protein